MWIFVHIVYPHEVLDELVLEKRIAELEIRCPQMTYRIKSFYFPMGTIIESINNFDN